MEERRHVRDEDPPEKYERPSINRLRLGLMFFMCLYLLGVPTEYGDSVRQICAFVPLAFYIISGYLVLRRGEDRLERIKRAIGRTALVFAVMVVVYLFVNILYCRYAGIEMWQRFLSKRTWFEFLVLNRWPLPVGNAIWYVQALLYTYIIVYILEKLRLLRFDWLFVILLLIFVTVNDELSDIVGFEILGYKQFPAGFLTRALPYVLLGELLHRKMRVLIQLRPIWYRVMCGIGVAGAIVEPLILQSYGSKPKLYGHLISLSVIAITLCLIAFQDHDSITSKLEDFFDLSRWDINIFYYLCQPTACAITILLERRGQEFYDKSSAFVGVFTFLSLFVLVMLIALVRKWINSRRPE